MERKWWKEAVFYQIYPMSFQDSNGDGIGDLKGITKRLDYLKELGVDAVWLSPFYKSPNDDNGYDISDYRDVLTEYGTLEDFDEMQREMHKRGIRLVLDLVVNHTSDEHPWFAESRKSKDNPYRDYYIWRDGKDGGYPNNWDSRFFGPAWQYCPETDQYYLHLYSPKQVDLNWDNPKVREEIYDMMDFWMERGADGFRIDAAAGFSKEEGLPDGIPRKQATGCEHYLNGPHIHEIYREMNQKVFQKYPEMVTVGETFGVTPEDALKYAGNDRGELDMIFQFQHVGLEYTDGNKFNLHPIKLPEFKASLSRWQVALDGKGWNSLYLANHDQPRSVSRWGDDQKYWKESAKLLYTMLLTMQGTPYIYQGEELGMTNMVFDGIQDFLDIQTLNAWKIYVEDGDDDPETFLKAAKFIGRDNARTPIQWDDSTNAGFTTGTPWMRVNPNYTWLNAKAELSDSDSIFRYIQKLIALRRQSLVAVYGSFTEHEPENEAFYIYNRKLDDQNLFVALNFTGEEQKLTVPKEILEAQKKSKLYISNYENDDVICDRIVRPYEAIVYEWE